MPDVRPIAAIGVSSFLPPLSYEDTRLGKIETRLTGGSDLAIVYRAITN